MKTGSVLRCTMFFSNLGRDELAALIWVLTPRNLVPNNEKKDPGAVGHLRMGLGKPLGLGALEVSIAKNGLRAIRGSDLAESYANLDGCLGLDTPVVGVEREDPSRDAMGEGHAARRLRLQRRRTGALHVPGGEQGEQPDRTQER